MKEDHVAPLASVVEKVKREPLEVNMAILLHRCHWVAPLEEIIFDLDGFNATPFAPMGGLNTIYTLGARVELLDDTLLVSRIAVPMHLIPLYVS